MVLLWKQAAAAQDDLERAIDQLTAQAAGVNNLRSQVAALQQALMQVCHTLLPGLLCRLLYRFVSGVESCLPVCQEAALRGVVRRWNTCTPGKHQG